MKRVLIAALVVLTSAVASIARPETDIVGTWKMDASRSKFVSSSGAPALVVIKFEGVGDLLRETLSVTNAGGLTTRTINYALNGRDLENGSGDDRVVSKIVSKDGVMTLQWTDDGGVFTRTMTMSADRRTLTISAHDSNPDTRADDVVLLKRQ